MWASHRHLPTWLLSLALLVVSLPARAGWVETTIASDVVTLDIERDGRAVVRHEILMKIKGGPLKGFDLEGVDADAEPLPDATVVLAASDGAGATPSALLMERREDGSLRIDIDHEKGLKRGSYLFKLGYRTNLLERNLIRPEGALVEVRWIGPRFPEGIDSARVIFRLPPASSTPRVADPEPALAGQSESPGVFLSNLRRAHDKDELEVIRPHVAKGEPVVWRMLADAKAFDAFAPAAPPGALEAPADRAPGRPGRRALLIAAAGLLSLLYSVLIALKWRALVRACELAKAKPRALIPLPLAPRAALAGALLGGAAILGAETLTATGAGVLLVLAMALAAQRSPALLPRARGPGQWREISAEQAFVAPRLKLPGRLLDAGAPSGFLLFVLALFGFGAGAALLMPISPYHALLFALGAACSLPIFCTGRASELPFDLGARPRALLRWLATKLQKNPRLEVTAWARFPEGQSDPDELRLRVLPKRALSGLISIEVGLEYQQGDGGPVALPCLIVRAQDGSLCHRALPEQVVWTRGRAPEERVAVIRPTLPTRALCLSLVERVSGMLSPTAARNPGPPPRAQAPGPPSSKPRRSAGKASSTLKPRRFSSPLQPT